MATPATPAPCVYTASHLTRRWTVAPAVLAVAAVAGANAIWGGSPAASKAAMNGRGPLTVGVGRAGIALSVVMLGESLTLPQVDSGLAVLAGVALSIRQTSSPEAVRLRPTGTTIVHRQASMYCQQGAILASETGKAPPKPSVA